MISVHWIPTHRGAEDKERFDLWQPPYVKIVCIDERPPYSEDVPLDSKIVVRNHPMSENYGNRMLNAMTAESSWPTSRLYEEYFAYTHDSRYADQRRAKVQQRPGFTAWVASADSPELTGIMHAETCQRMAVYLLGKGVAQNRMVFEGLNEPQLWANEPPDLVARYYKAFLGRLHDYGLHGVVGNFGVGWPGNGGVQDALVDWDFFKPVIGIMQPGDYLGLHEYWALNGPQENWRWWAGRFLQCPFDVTILVTECGIDTGVTGNWYGGWGDLPGTFDQKAERYCDELWWYAEQCAADGRVKGIFPFTYDIGGREWEKFDIRNTVWLEWFFRKLDAEGMPQPGGTMPIPTPSPIPPPVPEDGYKIIPMPIRSEPNAAMSYVDGYCAMVDAYGNQVKYMSGETKVIHLRWQGNSADAIEPVIVGPHAGYPNWNPGFYSIPLEPKVGQWEVAAEDRFRGIQSPWVAFNTVGTQVHIDFEWAPVGAQPQPQPSVPVEAIRNEAWRSLGIAYNPEAAFSRYARAQKLGNPVTGEFDASGYRAQGFAGGIVYAKIGDWGNIESIVW